MADFTRLIQITADASQAVREVNKFNKSTESSSKGVSGLVGVVGKIPWAAVAAGAAAAAGALVKVGQDFQEASREIAAATGATGPQLEQLNEDLKEIYRTANTNVNLSGVAELVGTLNTLTGAEGEQLQGLATTLLDASNLTNSSAQSFATSISQAANTFQVGADELQQTVDFMFTLSQDFGVSLDALSNQVREFGPVLKNAGKDINETAAFFARLEQQGISASRIMPALNAALRNAAKDGVEDLGGFLDDAIAGIREAKTETEALALATEIFGAEGAQRMTAFLRNAATDADVFAASVEGASGAVAEASLANQTLSEAMAALGREVLVAVEPLATVLVETLTEMVQWLRDNREQVDAVAQVFATGFAGIADVVSTVWSIVQPVFALMLEAIILIQEAAERLIAAFTRIRETASNLADAVTDKFTSMADGVKGAADRAWTGVTEGARNMWDEMVGNSIIPDMVTAILEWMNHMADGSTEASAQMADGVTSAMMDAQAATDSVAASMQETLVSGIGGMIDAAAKGKEAFKDYARSLLVDMAKIAAKALLLKALGVLFPGAGFGAGGVGSSLVGAAVNAGVGAISSTAGAGSRAAATSLSAVSPSSATGTSVAPVTVHNYSGQPVQEKTLSSGERQLIIGQAAETVRADFARSMQTGQGVFARSFEQGYLNRRRTG